jgi:RNA polymerase sporulation-specific sigma factor
MDFREHNDYEILHAIREGDPDALELMFAKYRPLISKIIGVFHLGYDYDDMMQESLLVLYRSVLTFEPAKHKTFTRYLEGNIRRRFITIVTQRVRRREIFQLNEHYIFEQAHEGETKSPYFDLYLDEIAKILTKREFVVYTLRELKNYSIEFIEQRLDLSSKSVYNSLHRAKAKIRSHFDNDLDKGTQS